MDELFGKWLFTFGLRSQSGKLFILRLAGSLRIALCYRGLPQQPRQVLPMHQLQVFKQVEEAHRNVCRQAILLKLRDEGMLTDNVPFPLANVPFCHLDVVG
ncbi:hypothetical protein [Mesorhizobium sp.]|uniref:hypothetical protein n=1 Tax=Mesorhizobium sp. TaxID=1871066 RepID=UPI0025F3AC3D|nr:hypothetical protein [Mesorhizobium sp.]